MCFGGHRVTVWSAHQLTSTLGSWPHECAECHIRVAVVFIVVKHMKIHFGLDLTQIALPANELNVGWQATLTTICIEHGPWHAFDVDDRFAMPKRQ